MFDKVKDLNKLRKIQADMKRQLEQIFVSHEKGKFVILMRGDKKIEKITIDNEEDKVLKDLINETGKKVDKKVEKQMRGQMGDLGIPGLS